MNVSDISYKQKSPCNNCPYRQDTPLKVWDKAEFEKLLKQDKEQFGKLYHCHKKNGSACIGWLMNQDMRNIPNLNLRMSLMKNNVGRDYLDKLKCNSPMYKTVELMSYENYPELKPESTPAGAEHLD